MTGYSNLSSFVQTCVLLGFLIVIHEARRETCDKTTCTGPLRYYKDLDCTPVYKNPDDCCAEIYDCSYLKDLSKDKCYVNGHEYNIEEELRKEDRNPCDVGCRCYSSNNKTASFSCAIVDCAYPELPKNCFSRRSPTRCCPQTICLEEGEERATCEVDGKTYLDGESFKPKSDPDLNCYCMPGYKGENIEPFCKKPNRPYCTPLFRNADQVRRKCVPVYERNQNPQKDCNVNSICQDGDGVVVHKHGNTKTTSTKKNEMCLFGNITMQIGEELDASNRNDCVHCKCEVPPVPTCRRVEYDHCTR